MPTEHHGTNLRRGLPHRHWSKPFAYIANVIRTRSRYLREETPADKSARRTATATVWLAIFTVVLAAVSTATLIVLKRQLGEMQGSGKQTDHLLGLYEQQVGEVTKQAGETHQLASAAKRQAEEALVQANATRSLAETSRSALVSVQRAFVFATGFSGVRIGDPNDPSKVSFLKFSMVWENSGTTPLSE